MKMLIFALTGMLLNIQTCKEIHPDFVSKKIKELQSKPVYNPPASVWQWDYKDSTYYYVTSDCCDRFNELYNEDGVLICHPDGGYTGKGDGKCPFDAFSNDTANLKKTLLWRDNRGE